MAKKSTKQGYDNYNNNESQYEGNIGSNIAQVNTPFLKQPRQKLHELNAADSSY